MVVDTLGTGALVLLSTTGIGTGAGLAIKATTGALSSAITYYLEHEISADYLWPNEWDVSEDKKTDLKNEIKRIAPI